MTMGVVPTSVGVLTTVAGVIRDELMTLRAQGVPFKAGFDRVARAMRVSARRVRQYHERAVAEDAVTALEWLAAVEIQNQRRRARIAAARELLAEESQHGDDLP